MGQPSIEIIRNRYAGRINIRATFQFGNELRASCLRLSLIPLEAMPAALALAGNIAHVDDDGPMAARAFANMALHFVSPLSLGFASSGLVSTRPSRRARIARISDWMVS